MEAVLGGRRAGYTLCYQKKRDEYQGTRSLACVYVSLGFNGHLYVDATSCLLALVSRAEES